MSDWREKIKGWRFGFEYGCFGLMEGGPYVPVERFGLCVVDPLEAEIERLRAENAELKALQEDSTNMSLAHEADRLRAENAELKDMVAEAKRKLYPRLWSEAEREAWHKNIPDVEKAFEALREASHD